MARRCAAPRLQGLRDEHQRAREEGCPRRRRAPRPSRALPGVERHQQGDLARRLFADQPLDKPGLKRHRWTTTWSACQTEWATDIVFENPKLAAIYPALARHATNHFQSPDVMRFLGRKANGNFTGEINHELQAPRRGCARLTPTRCRQPPPLPRLAHRRRRRPRDPARDFTRRVRHRRLPHPRAAAPAPPESCDRPDRRAATPVRQGRPRAAPVARARAHEEDPPTPSLPAHRARAVFSPPRCEPPATPTSSSSFARRRDRFCCLAPSAQESKRRVRARPAPDASRAPARCWPADGRTQPPARGRSPRARRRTATP